MRTADLFLAAGMATSPRFMEEAGKRLAALLGERGWDARVMPLFPYGDRSRNRLAQIREIRHDVLLRPGRHARSVGGGRIAGAMRSAYRGGMLLLVGHSGGAIAGLHAVQVWDEPLQVHLAERLRLVMVGSPRSPVPSRLKPNTLHIGARRKGGGAGEPILRLGTWGGWEKVPGRRLPRWNPDLYAPGTRRTIDLIGGHTDYFRSSPPYVDGEGKTNLDKLLECILEWLDLS